MLQTALPNSKYLPYLASRFKPHCNPLYPCCKPPYPRCKPLYPHCKLLCPTKTTPLATDRGRFLSSSTPPREPEISSLSAQGYRSRRQWRPRDRPAE